MAQAPLDFSQVVKPSQQAPPSGGAPDFDFGAVVKSRAKSPDEMTDLERVVAGLPPKDSRSGLRRVLDAALTPLISQEQAARFVGSPAPVSSTWNPLETLKRLALSFPHIATNRPAVLMLDDPLVQTIGGILQNVVEAPSSIPSMAKGFGQGAAQGASQLTDPVSLASFLTGGTARAIRPALVRALRALPDAERALVAMRAAGKVDEVARIRGELQSLRTQAEMQQALSRMARGVDVGASATLGARGVERVASADSLPEAGAGLVEAAFGALGVKTAPKVPGLRPSVPLHAGELPPAPRFVAGAEGVSEIGAPRPAAAAPPARPAESRPAVRLAAVAYRDTSGRVVYSGDPNAADSGVLQSVDPPRPALPPGPRFVASEDSVALLEDAERLAAGGGRGRTPEARRAASEPTTTDWRNALNSDEYARLESLAAQLERPLKQYEPKGRLHNLIAGDDAERVPRATVALALRQFLTTGKPNKYSEAARRLVADGADQPPSLNLSAARSTLDANRSAPADSGFRAGHNSAMGWIDPANPRGAGTARTDTDLPNWVTEADPNPILSGGREPGEEGFIEPILLQRMGGAAAGAAAGAASGETPEERLQRAVTFGIAGAVAPSLVSRAARPGAAAPILRSTVTTAAGDVLPTTGRPAAKPKTPMDDPLAHLEPFLSKFPEEVRGGIKDAITDAGGYQAQRRGTVDQARIEQLAEGVRVDLQRRLKTGTALNAEQVREHVNAVAGAQAKVNDLAAKVAKGQNTDADIVAMEQARAQLNTILASVMGARSEAGRALAQFRTLARIIDTGNPDLLAEAANTLRGNAAEFAAAFAQQPNDALGRYRWLQGRLTPSVMDRTRNYYYSSILSGLKTHERNTLGNAANVLTGLLTKPVAAGVDLVKSRALGRPREVFFSELPSEVVGAFRGIQRGFSDAVFSARHGVNRSALTQSLSAAEAGKLDVPRMEFAGGGANPFNWPGRALDSADQFFRGITRESQAASLAHAQAKKEGKRGNALTVRMAELLAGADDVGQKVLAQADAAARRTVFQEQGGPVVRTLQLMQEKVPPVALVLPFVRTPGNILRQGFEFSPAGFLMKAARTEGRTATEAQARAVMGSAALGGLAWLLATDQIEITGSGPKTAAERAAWMESGKRPNSIRIGDKYVEYALFQPVSVPLMVLANAMETWKADGAREEDAVALALDVAQKTARSVVDLSFLSGVSDLFVALEQGPGRLQRLVSRAGHSLTPFAGAQRTVTQALDPVVRKPENITDGIKANVPGLSTSVPARRDRFGAVVTREGGPLKRAADPFNVSTRKDDPVLQELERLGLGVGFPTDRLVIRGEQVELKDAEADALEQARGQERRRRIERLIGLPNYNRLPKGAQKKLLQRAMAEASEAVKGRAIRLLKRGQPLTAEALAGGTP